MRKKLSTSEKIAAIAEIDDLSRIGLFIRGDQLRRLRERQKETGATVSELIRRAIDAYLTK